LNPVAILVWGVLFGCAGYGEATRFQKRHGRTPFGWPALVWGFVWFLSWVIGAVLMAIGERIGRNAAAKAPMNGKAYSQPVYASAGYGPPPVYGQPAYPPPGYGQPANPPTGYAQPAYSPPSPPPPVPHSSNILPR
jgi:hypothetical protein